MSLIVARERVMERLETRTHLTGDYAALEGSTLVLTATAETDWSLIIARKSTYRVFLNDATFSLKFPKSAVTSVIVYLGEGDDAFSAPAIAIPIKAFGGPGDDSIITGFANDRIEGGEGNDSMSGDAGDDRLYGGAGDDVLHGYAGRDYLFGDAGSDTNYARDRRDRIIDSVELTRA